MNGSERRFYGKYRGVVTENDDSGGNQGRKQGRLRAKVPDVFGSEQSGWALPCVPYAGKGVGIFLMPPKNASVWIEFEHGDPDYPIWTGCFWAEGEAPVDPYTPDQKIVQTGIGRVTINDSSSDAGITIETTKDPKMKIVINKDGIAIDNGKGATVKLSDSKVSINGSALEVQ
jgi:uncharacterized protein involved in type VI secretion and phage assembly